MATTVSLEVSKLIKQEKRAAAIAWHAKSATALRPIVEGEVKEKRKRDGVVSTVAAELKSFCPTAAMFGTDNMQAFVRSMVVASFSDTWQALLAKERADCVSDFERDERDDAQSYASIYTARVGAAAFDSLKSKELQRDTVARCVESALTAANSKKPDGSLDTATRAKLAKLLRAVARAVPEKGKAKRKAKSKAKSKAK